MNISKVTILILSLTFSGCSLWTTDAPTDMADEHESVVKTLTASCKKGNQVSCQNLKSIQNLD